MFLVNGRDTPWMYDGQTFSQPTMTLDGTAGKALPKCVAVTAMPKDDVVFWCGFEGPNDGPGGVASSPSMIFTSQFGDPLSGKALDFVRCATATATRSSALRRGASSRSSSRAAPTGSSPGR